MKALVNGKILRALSVGVEGGSIHKGLEQLVQTFQRWDPYVACHAYKVIYPLVPKVSSDF